MICLDNIAIFQVSYGAGKLEDAMEGTSSEMKLFHSSAEQALCC